MEVLLVKLLAACESFLSWLECVGASATDQLPRSDETRRSAEIVSWQWRQFEMCWRTSSDRVEGSSPSRKAMMVSGSNRWQVMIVLREARNLWQAMVRAVREVRSAREKGETAVYSAGV